MPTLSRPSGAVPAAIFYVTIGALGIVWAGVWWWFFPPETPTARFWVMGFLISGLVLLCIGAFLGRIGRAARHAEMPPPEVTPTAARAEVAAAANAQAPAAVPVAPAAVPTAVPATPTVPAAGSPPVAKPYAVSR
jgi:hypothetical protein